MRLLQINRRHSASNAALESSNAPIFLLDAYSHIFVHYTSSCPASIPCPPPQQSLLWRQVIALRAQRWVGCMCSEPACACVTASTPGLCQKVFMLLDLLKNLGC